jgi:hypothetical protein
MYVITRFDSALSAPELATYETADEALAHLATLRVAFIEEDAQNPGCYDGIGSDGRVYSIEKR